MNGVNYSNLTSLVSRSFLTATTFKTFELMLEQLIRAHFWITYSEPGNIKWNSSQWILIDSLTESVVQNETTSWSLAVQTDLDYIMHSVLILDAFMFGIFFVIIANTMTQNLEQEIHQMCNMLISIPRVYIADIKILKAAMDEQEKISVEETKRTFSFNVHRFLKIFLKPFSIGMSLSVSEDNFKIKMHRNQLEELRQGKNKATDKIPVNLIFGATLQEESELGENSVLSDSSEELNSIIDSPVLSPVLSPKNIRASRSPAESKSLNISRFIKSRSFNKDDSNF
ncbi:hypothetical protein HK096_008978 [Nowakowskiella sp. JEL0078]|nr:hypothetical protein HK096_008978 [Nowakowskiella sp. JEL0078]